MEEDEAVSIISTEARTWKGRKKWHIKM